MANYIFVQNGNAGYEEATITIFEGNIRQGYGSGSNPTAEEKIVEVFSHEGDHDTNQQAINAIKDRQEGKANNYNVEKPAEALGDQVMREIQAAKAAKGKKRP